MLLILCTEKLDDKPENSGLLKERKKTEQKCTDKTFVLGLVKIRLLSLHISHPRAGCCHKIGRIARGEHCCGKKVRESFGCAASEEEIVVCVVLVLGSMVVLAQD